MWADLNEIPSAPGEGSGRGRNSISEISRWRWNYREGMAVVGEWRVVLLSGGSGRLVRGRGVFSKDK